MGTSATTLSTLLGKRVNITTPRVSTCRGNEYLDEYEKPIVSTEVSYTQGVDGTNVFLIKKEDALAITEVLVGSDTDLEELYLSAISEVMNQMVGSSSTSLADLLHVSVNISPPVVKEITRDILTSSEGELLIKVSFRLEIEDLLESNLVQIMSFEFGKKLVRRLIGDEPEAEQPPAPAPRMPAAEQPPAPAPRMPKANEKDVKRMQSEEKVELKAVKYESFDSNASDFFMNHPEMSKNIDLIIDVPLHVTVVLGKTRKSIKEILDINRGSIIVLDRLAGEMVDVLVNGKLFAKGEVVVIDDNYGVRITEITSEQQKDN
jgi:flagellar motor switch protein FliN/FliY